MTKAVVRTITPELEMLAAEPYYHAVGDEVPLFEAADRIACRCC